MLEHRFSSHLIGKLKPDQGSFEHVLQCLDCKASSVLFLDDNEINVKSARDIGMIAYKVQGPNEIKKIFKERDILSSL